MGWYSESGRTVGNAEGEHEGVRGLLWWGRDL